MKNRYFTFVTGMLLGAVLFGGGAAYAAGVMTEYAPQTAYVDGAPVHMEAYNIDGYNYVKLRDIGQAVGFNVYWDGQSVQMESGAPYTGLPPAQPTQPNSGDYSQEANPAVFTGELTRDIYNAVRDTIERREDIMAGITLPRTVPWTQEAYTAMDMATVAIGNYPSYEPTSTEDGAMICAVKYPSTYDNAVAHTQPFIDSIAGLGQREKVKSLVWYVCDRMEYSSAIASPTKILASDGVTSGNCMSYAHSLLFLCNRAEIPCILVHSDDHQWNMVYVDGQWWNVDVSADDTADSQVRDRVTILHSLSEQMGSTYTDSEPDITRFAQELLVPGSTK